MGERDIIQSSKDSVTTSDWTKMELANRVTFDKSKCAWLPQQGDQNQHLPSLTFDNADSNQVRKGAASNAEVVTRGATSANKSENVFIDTNDMKPIHGVSTNAQVSQFARTWHITGWAEYNPVYPLGLGNWNPGETYTASRGTQSSRAGTMRNNRDGSTTYLYTGGDFGNHFYVYGPPFIATEVLSAKGQLMESHVMYIGAIRDQNFKATNGSTINIPKVLSVDATRGTDGNYTSVVKDLQGNRTTFTVAPDGTVTSVKRS